MTPAMTYQSKTLPRYGVAGAQTSGIRGFVFYVLKETFVTPTDYRYPFLGES